MLESNTHRVVQWEEIPRSFSPDKQERFFFDTDADLLLISGKTLTDIGGSSDLAVLVYVL